MTGRSVDSRSKHITSGRSSEGSAEGGWQCCPQVRTVLAGRSRIARSFLPRDEFVSACMQRSFAARGHMLRRPGCWRSPPFPRSYTVAHPPGPARLILGRPKVEGTCNLTSLLLLLRPEVLDMAS